MIKFLFVLMIPMLFIAPPCEKVESDWSEPWAVYALPNHFYPIEPPSQIVRLNTTTTYHVAETIFFNDTYHAPYKQARIDGTVNWVLIYSDRPHFPEPARILFPGRQYVIQCDTPINWGFPAKTK